MRNDIAIVRQHILRIDGVFQAWFEWNLEDTMWIKTLVVEVDFDTDPNAPEFRQNVLDAVESTATEVLKSETTMIVSHLKIVPKAVR